MLFVEPDLVIADALARPLEDWFELVPATSVGAAFRVLETQPNLRAAVLDVDLCNGFGIIARMRARCLPIRSLVLSGRSSDAVATCARRHQISDYDLLPKRAQHPSLIQAVWDAMVVADVVGLGPFQTGKQLLHYLARCVLRSSDQCAKILKKLAVKFENAERFLVELLRGAGTRGATSRARLDRDQAKDLWSELLSMWGINDLRGILVALGHALDRAPAGPFGSALSFGQKLTASLLPEHSVSSRERAIFEHTLAGRSDEQAHSQFGIGNRTLERARHACLEAAGLARIHHALAAAAAKLDQRSSFVPPN